MPFWNVGTTNEIAVIVNVMWRIARALINALEVAGEGKIMKPIRKASVTFRYIELSQNQKRAVCAFVRGLSVWILVPHALKTTCHTHVHCDNYIPACQANPSKVTIRNFSCRKIRMACETKNNCPSLPFFASQYAHMCSKNNSPAQIQCSKFVDYTQRGARNMQTRTNKLCETHTNMSKTN